MMHADSSPRPIKGRGNKTRKTKIRKRETYSRRDFKGFKSGEEIYDTITKLIEEENIPPGKREGIYCTVFKHLQSNARTSMMHDMTPDLDGAANLGTKELLAVLLSIARRDVDKLIRNSTQELKVDVSVELSEGEVVLNRFHVQYYTTSEDLIGWVLADRGVSDSVLDYQIAIVKSPFKGKSKIKSIMCAVGQNNQHSMAAKQSRVLYPSQYPIQEMGDAPKVEYSSTDGIPRVTSCYFIVSPREPQPLTIYHRRSDGETEEETLHLRPSSTAQEIIEEAVNLLDLDNDPLAYKLIMKAFAFDEKNIALEEQPLQLVEAVEDFQEGYPQIWIEDQEADEVTRTNSFMRKHSSRRASRKKQRPVSTGPLVSSFAETDAPPLSIEDPESPSSNEISRIQNHLYHASLRRKTQSTKNVGQIREQESHLKNILVEQDKVISALATAVNTAESISPQNSIKDVSETLLKETLAEKQTQIWELEENRNKDRELILQLSSASKSFEHMYHDLEEKFRTFKNSAKNELEIEKREKRELEKQLERAAPGEAVMVYDNDTVSEMKLQAEKDQEIIDMTTKRNAELKEEIKQLRKQLSEQTNYVSPKLEVEGMQKSSGGMPESISINDFTEWSKDLDDLKKRNDNLLFKNKQLTADNVKLTELIDDSRSSIKQAEKLAEENMDLKEASSELKETVKAREAEIASLTERLNGAQDQDGSFDDYQEKYFDLYEKNQHLESVMSGTIEKLRSKLGILDDEKVQLQNTINGLNTELDGKKRHLKEYDYMKNRVEMMEMEHSHLKEFSSQLIEENKQIEELNKTSFEKDQQMGSLGETIRELKEELAVYRGLEKVNCSVQIDDPRIDELGISLEEARGRLDSRNAVVESMNKKLSQKEEEIHVLQGMTSDYQNTNEFLTTEMDRLKKQNSSLEAKVANKSEEISNFKSIMDALNEEISSSRSVCVEGNCSSAVRLKDEHDEKVRAMEEAIADSKVNFNKYSDTTGQLMALQTKYDELTDDFSILEADKADADETIALNNVNIKDKEGKISELMELTARLRDEVDRANEKLRELTTRRDELARELTDTRLKSADKELELNEALEDLRTFKRKAKQSKEHAESLQDLNEALNAQLHELQDNDCSKGECPASIELTKTLEAKVIENADLQSQRRDLQTVIIKSKNELAEAVIEREELEASYLEAKEQAESYRAQLRSIQRKLDPRKKKDHIDNLENQVEMYQAEVASLKSVTRNLEDEVERMSVIEQDSTDVVSTLNAKNTSLEKQLGDAKGEIYDLEEQLAKFKESLRDSQNDSATVDTYLSERSMLKDTIAELEQENESLSSEKENLKSSLTALKEELSIVKGVRDIQTRDTVSTKQTSLKLKKLNEEHVEEISYLKETLQEKTDECARQVDIIERHKTLTREMDQEIAEMKAQLHQKEGLVNGNSDIVANLKSVREDDDSVKRLDTLNDTITDLSSTVRSLTEDNTNLEQCISKLNDEEQVRQTKIAELEARFQAEVEALHAEHKNEICELTDEIKKWVNENKVLSEEILLLEQEKENLERKQVPDQVEMQDALHEATSELTLQSKMAQISLAQFEEAQDQIETMEDELVTYKKRCSVSEKTLEDLTRKLQENDRALNEYKQSLEDLHAADENKRSEIRLLNKMVKEYANKSEENEHEYASLRSKYKEKKTKIEELQKEIVFLKKTNAEFENVIVALESTSATDTVDNSAKTRKINELSSLLTEAEAVASKKSTELETLRLDSSRLQEENDQLVEEVKSYQEEWRRLTTLLSSVNHTNHANMDSCKRLENKLDDIEFKVTETNVHIDICEGDMFSKTEALVRENSLLEAKISEKTASLEQSEHFLRESHDNVNLLQGTISQLESRIAQLQTKETQLVEESPSSENSERSLTELEREIRSLTTELQDKSELLAEAKSEKESDESAFKMSLDTIVRSYEDKLTRLTEEAEAREKEIEQLQSELKSGQSR